MPDTDAIVLLKVRAQWVHIFQPRTQKDDAGTEVSKFSITGIIPKDHPQLSQLWDMMQRCATDKWGERAPMILKELMAADRVCIHNGDTKMRFEGMAGNYYINATNRTRPNIKGADGRTPVTEADGLIYSGAYVNLILSMWAQEPKNPAHGKRINCTVLGVQFAGHAPAFGGMQVADDAMFPVVEVPQAAASPAGFGAMPGFVAPSPGGFAPNPVAPAKLW
jgi:hypothetical protein